MGSSAFDDIIKLFPVSLHGRVLLCCANKSEACTWYEVFCCFWVNSAEHPALFCLLSCCHQSRPLQQALFLADAPGPLFVKNREGVVATFSLTAHHNQQATSW